MKKLLIFLLLCLITFPVINDLLRPGYFPMQDDIQAMRVLEMNKCIKDWQIPCRWVPDMGNGYGYPEFNYYGPAPYYLMEGLHLGGLGYLDSVKAGVVLITFAGIVGMYFLAKSLWGEQGGIISVLFYAYAPYRALDIYVRCDIAELTILAITPYLFWAVRELILGKKKFLLLFAVSLGIFLSTHNPSVVIFGPFLALWAIYVFISNKKEVYPHFRERIILLVSAGIWGLLLGSFYFLPAWFEKNFVHTDLLTSGYLNYMNHFVNFKQLLISRYWGYGDSVPGPNDGLYLGVGQLHWILSLLTLAGLFIVKKKKEFSVALFWILAGWAALFLATDSSFFIWKNISIFSFLQFPWRFLILATFSFSLIIGALYLIFKKYSFLLLIVSFGLCAFFYIGYFHPARWIQITDAQKFSGQSLIDQETLDIDYLLPIYAKRSPVIASPNEPVFIDGNGKILNGTISSNKQTWKIEVLGTNAIVELPSFYFPGWKVYSDNEEKTINYSNEFGLMRIELVKGNHDLTAKFSDTKIRSIANISTVLGLLLIPVYLVLRKKLLPKPR